MTKREKRLQKLRRSPKNVSFDELKQTLEDFGFQHVRTADSHHTFFASIDERNWRLTVPLQHPMKTPYVRQALRAIDEIIELQKALAEASEDDDELSEEEVDNGESEN